jgi:predicted  nucleic acid-binding Zn-ribbon protein
MEDIKELKDEIKHLKSEIKELRNENRDLKKSTKNQYKKLDEGEKLLALHFLKDYAEKEIMLIQLTQTSRNIVKTFQQTNTTK